MDPTSMLNSPGLFQMFLSHEGLLDDLYDAMRKNDLADVVMEAWSILKKTGSIPPLIKLKKNKAKSAEIRSLGNQAYKDGEHQKALALYNKALLSAPKGSEEMALVLGNRSALLFDCKMFLACIKDIDTCFSLGCPDSITNKLVQRRQKASSKAWTEQLDNDMRYPPYVKDFFIFNERKNPQIPCASADVGVIVNSRIPTVVAVNEIKVGKLLAVEKAFVSNMDLSLSLMGCFQCNKMDLNLFPCDNCCLALFCSKECQETSLKEYHRVECAIIELYSDTSSIPVSRLALEAALKLKGRFGSWKEFVKATSKVGLERMKESEINDIFDVNNNFSMLNLRDDTIFTAGQMYNGSFGVAIVLHYLGHLKTFFPVDKIERDAAMRAFGRLVMFYTVHSVHTQIPPAMSVIAKRMRMFCGIVNHGIFPFVGKLKHSCVPNVLAVGLNDTIALVAVQPIKPGSELTIAYVGHWLDNHIDKELRRNNMFSTFNTACDCVVCNGNYLLIGENAKPTETQLRVLEKLNLDATSRDFSTMFVQDIYPKCCKALAFLSDLQFSKEYRSVFVLFRKCLLDIQDCYSQNIMLDAK